MTYPFPKGKMRAYAVRVIDGDTFDLVVDVGFHMSVTARFRLLGVNTYELNDKDPVRKDLAERARNFVCSVMLPAPGTGWNVSIETEKDPDHFGRWLCVVKYMLSNGIEVDLGEQLLSFGFAEVR